MPKYNIGDKVLVRPDLVSDESYSMEDDSENENTVTNEMLELYGTVVTIEDISGCGQYYIEECGFQWTDGMFVGKVDDSEESNNYKSFFENTQEGKTK